MATAMVIFMIIALARDDTEKKWRWLSLFLGVIMLGICVAGCLSKSARTMLFKCTPEIDQPSKPKIDDTKTIAATRAVA